MIGTCVGAGMVDPVVVALELSAVELDKIALELITADDEAAIEDTAEVEVGPKELSEPLGAGVDSELKAEDVTGMELKVTVDCEPDSVDDILSGAEDDDTGIVIELAKLDDGSETIEDDTDGIKELRTTELEAAEEKLEALVSTAKLDESTAELEITGSEEKLLLVTGIEVDDGSETTEDDTVGIKELRITELEAPEEKLEALVSTAELDERKAELETTGSEEKLLLVAGIEVDASETVDDGTDGIKEEVERTELTAPEEKLKTLVSIAELDETMVELEITGSEEKLLVAAGIDVEIPKSELKTDVKTADERLSVLLTSETELGAADTNVESEALLPEKEDISDATELPAEEIAD
ncbi:34fddc75-48b6-4e53-94e5-f5db342b5f77-CDS [Sclerotinia trifoliorum]|uniref:34fddc75-48b6-4e53-94e5-f5db342b5f77-CDS n=1 Tax=Sclerotinia trifoliorum TaxID=28548 RepID=A0A8H2ZVF9_9HELO|nr:34fddc75-48b6-4e53-94e5-f5db342b5f77-CDS [Sclerotinia trifoliorum]